MVRLALLILLVLAAPARAQDIPPGAARLEVIIHPTGAKPFEQEMILVTVRGVYRIPITLEKLSHPPLEDFGWMQLGRDKWRDEMIGGLKHKTLERRVALFAKRRGTLVIGPYIHRMTVLDSRGRRMELEVRSAPVSVDVARKPEGTGWWLPAQTIAVEDTWSSPPDSLAFGAATQRTIRITARGAAPDRLPPAPVMQGKGLIAFPDPEERSVELTPDGPVATVVWRWTVRMLSPDNLPLETKPLEWFDTVSRTPRKIIFAPQRISLPGTVATPPAPPRSVLGSYGLVAGLAAGFFMGLAFLLPGWRLKSRAEITAAFQPALPRRTARVIRSASMARDAPALWRAVRGFGPHRTRALEAALFSRDENHDIGEIGLGLLAELRRQKGSMSSKRDARSGG